MPQVTVTGEGPVAYRLAVSGATPGKPFWLVLGQSLSPGWAAKATGLGSLGKPQLVDGYANGWLITPDVGDVRRVAGLDRAEPGLGRASGSPPLRCSSAC